MDASAVQLRSLHNQALLIFISAKESHHMILAAITAVTVRLYCCMWQPCTAPRPPLS